jgi:hypothetical protein
MKEYLGVLFGRRDDSAFVLRQRQYLLNLLKFWHGRLQTVCDPVRAQEKDW